MEPNSTQFPKISPEDMTNQLRNESADYAASQPAERNQGSLYSGVNRLVRGSNNINPEPATKGTSFTYTGTKDPYRI